MADVDNVQLLIEELNQSFNRFLAVASVGELLIIAIFLGILSAAFQMAGRMVFGLAKPLGMK